jgi:hypothetical protein
VTWRRGRRATYIFLKGKLNGSMPSPTEVITEAKNCARHLVVLDLTSAESATTPMLEWLEQLSVGLEAEQMKLRVVAENGSRIRWLLDMLRFSNFVLVLGSVREALAFGRQRPTPQP